MDRGYVRLYRSLQDKGYYKNPEYVLLWVHLLIKASYSPKEYFFDGSVRQLLPGQFITGRDALSKETGIHRSKVERILGRFESEHQIEQQKTNKFRIISILNWNKYQKSEHLNEQQMSNKRATNEQQVSTINKDKKEKKDNNKTLYGECVLLSQEEYKKLTDKHGQNLTDKAIELLNNYIQSSGKKYKSHYHTLLLWPMQRAQEGMDGSHFGNNGRSWLRNKGQELSGDAQRAIDDVKRLERERAARLAAPDKAGTNAG